MGKISQYWQRLKSRGEIFMERFAGVGMRNVLTIAIMTMILIVVFKVVFNKYPISGVSDMVNAV